ncbi:GNAT family N-acetyltransferase [Sporolactobacillus sp. CQH2019]|uniref:GNAT family N-acetyltransferase n=1 Tax=Sporolactobacillus sp. CQH2019 TaxID=3023512 RepID=UPI002367F5E6|nr:GNAT family N-acetyltransferase [Sporolactobacillus sp. CQH2019]MDD9149808.1 GNAT family N-acetyltransferase [Sporolactobacillus sp. CQH2019]
MELNWKIRKFSQLTVRELYEIYKIREAVFVVEQNCPYHEVDENDLKSIHVYALDDRREIIAYARIFQAEDAVTFGRVLINRKYRGKGLGKELVSKLIEVIGDTAPGAKVVIEAQEYIQPLYASFGFKRTSEVYLIDNIPHVTMERVQSR